LLIKQHDIDRLLGADSDPLFGSMRREHMQRLLIKKILHRIGINFIIVKDEKSSFPAMLTH